MTRELVGALTIALVLVAVAALSLHERHYRGRRELIGAARHEGLERRLAVVEEILIETRST